MRKILFVLAIITMILSSCSKDSSDSVVFNGLTIKKADLPNKLNWNDARAAATAAGPGWRLPTKAELKIMYDNRNAIGGFNIYTGEYWSSEELNANSAWICPFGTFGNVTISKSVLGNVRLVK